MDKKTILIVDDEEDVLSLLKTRLTAKGYSVITGRHGLDAIDLAKSQSPDLIILDILMPGMEGPEVAAKLKESPDTRDIPVMFLTCLYAKAEESESGHLVGDRLIFAKPFDSEELIGTIERLI